MNELVSNALRHAFPDRPTGTIRIRLAMLDAGHVLLDVEDDGIGLPPEVDESGNGSTGLDLVSGLAGQLGGTVTLDRCRGAAFTIFFPLEAGEAKARKARAGGRKAPR